MPRSHAARRRLKGAVESCRQGIGSIRQGVEAAASSPPPALPPAAPAVDEMEETAEMHTKNEESVKPSAYPIQHFETSDLNLASFLRCRGFRILDILRQGSRASFVFGDSQELHRAILEYANDGTIGVRSFCSTLRDLKGIAR